MCLELVGLSPKLPEYLPWTPEQVHAHQRETLKQKKVNAAQERETAFRQALKVLEENALTFGDFSCLCL